MSEHSVYVIFLLSARKVSYIWWKIQNIIRGESRYLQGTKELPPSGKASTSPC